MDGLSNVCKLIAKKSVAEKEACAGICLAASSLINLVSHLRCSGPACLGALIRAGARGVQVCVLSTRVLPHSSSEADAPAVNSSCVMTGKAQQH